MDRMQATPRNAFFGGLADFLAAGSSPQRTQQMQGLMEFLQVPDIAKTLDRASRRPNALMDEILGAGETALTLGTGAAAGIAGMPYGLFKGLTSGQYLEGNAADIAAKEAEAFMERNTYVPRTESGQDNLSAIAEIMDKSKLPPIIPEAVMLSSIPRAAAAAQAERLGIAAEKALEAPLQRAYDKGGLTREMLLAMSQGTGSNAIDPSKISTFPKRMAATNKAIQEGGDIANATARDYSAIMKKAQEEVRQGKAESLPEAMKLTPKEVQQRRELANAVLEQPIEKWSPPEHSLLDRGLMSQIGNIGGAPGVDQAKISRYVPARADLSHVKAIAEPRNMDIVKRSAERGLDATEGGFYKSYQPMRAALDEAGYATDVFDKGLAATSFASAQNSVALENAIGSLIMRLEQQGIPITKENVLKAHDEFKKLTGGRLSMMEGHYNPFAKFLDQGFPSGEKQAQKISSFYQNKRGNFMPYVFDTHEAAGTSYATPYGAYFWGQGGAKDTEYGLLEKILQDKLAAPLGIDPAIAQEGRWFGLGELTGLKTGGGDWLDNYERQAAWSAQQLGKKLTRKEQQRYVTDVFAGKERMLPWWKKSEPIPDVRKKK